jgi:hypothetical protein
VRIETREDDCIILESRDRGVRVETTTEHIDELANDERLELVSEDGPFFRPQTGFHLVANSEAPAGRRYFRIFRAGDCFDWRP